MIKDTFRKEYVPQLERNLTTRLIIRFREKYRFMGGDEIIRFIVEDILSLVKEEYRSKNKLKKGQILWNGVKIEQKRKSGKSFPMRDTKTKPIVLSLISEQDIQKLRKGAKLKELKKEVIERLTREAYDQGTVLNQVDLGLLVCRSRVSIMKYIREIEKEKKIHLPTRGRIHDLGPTVTHKKEIVRMRFQKYSMLEIKRRTCHSTEAIDRYHRDFDRVSMLEAKLLPQEISFVTGMSLNLVKEYIGLKRELFSQKICLGG